MFIVFGPVNYPIAVLIRALHFLTIFMHEATVISILIMRQIIILKVLTMDGDKIHQMSV